MKSHPTGPLQLDAVQRLLRSTAFRESREASSEICDDATSLRDLTERVRHRGYAEGEMSDLADRIAAALHLLDDRAEHLRCEGPAVPPARATRHRLLVAALHYLARPDDVLPDEASRGDIDDVVVLREVLGTAEDDLRPYLAAVDASKDPKDPKNLENR